MKSLIFLMLMVVLMPLVALGQDTLKVFVLTGSNPGTVAGQMVDQLMVKAEKELRKHNFFDYDSIEVQIIGLTDMLPWKDQPAGGTKDINIGKARAKFYANLFNSFGVKAEAVGYELLTKYRGAKVVVLKRQPDVAVELGQAKFETGQKKLDLVGLDAVKRINVLVGTSFNLSGLVTKKFFDGSRSNNNEGLLFYSQDTLIDVTEAGNIDALKEGVAKVIVEDTITWKSDTTEVNIIDVQQPQSIILAGGPTYEVGLFTGDRGYFGVGGNLKFTSGWLLGGSYAYSNVQQTRNEERFDLFLGHNLSFIQDELYLFGGMTFGQQLDDNWASRGVTLGGLYSYSLVNNINFYVQGGLIYERVHQKAKVGPLKFWSDQNDPLIIHYSQDLTQPEKNFNRLGGGAKIGLILEL